MASAFKNQKRLNSYIETLCSNSCKTISLSEHFVKRDLEEAFFLSCASLTEIPTTDDDCASCGLSSDTLGITCVDC